MAVYVDKARNRYGRMIMCHMLADTPQELHDMADCIGVARKWFQPASTPHYDICLRKRELAIEHGAKVLSRKEVGNLIRAIRRSDFVWHP